MSIPAWPTSLPQKLLAEGYGEKLDDSTVIRTKMDIGPAKVRRRSTSTVEPIKGSMWLTSAQWSTLRFFYYTTLARALKFSWVHPTTGAAVNLRFVTAPALSGGRGPYVSAALDLEVVP